MIQTKNKSLNYVTDKDLHYLKKYRKCSTKQHKIHNAWNPIKNYQPYKKMTGECDLYSE